MDFGELIEIIGMLPNLRRLRWQGAFDGPSLQQYNGGADPGQEIKQLVSALETQGIIEALYLNIDSTVISADTLDEFGRLRSLKELVIVADSCEFVARRGVWDPVRADTQFVTERLHKALPEAAVLCQDAACIDPHVVDPLVRVFLPTIEENWHLDGDVRGLENLSWMHTRPTQLKSARVREVVSREWR